MTLQERLAMTQGQDNGMDIILGGIPAAAQQEQVQQLPATALRPKSNHTFKVRTGSPHYTALVDSIRSSGIRTPLLVRRDPVQPGAYEIIAGHTRWTAAQELELAHGALHRGAALRCRRRHHDGGDQHPAPGLAALRTGQDIQSVAGSSSNRNGDNTGSTDGYNFGH